VKTGRKVKKSITTFTAFASLYSLLPIPSGSDPQGLTPAQRVFIAEGSTSRNVTPLVSSP